MAVRTQRPIQGCPCTLIVPICMDFERRSRAAFWLGPCRVTGAAGPGDKRATIPAGRCLCRGPPLDTATLPSRARWRPSTLPSRGCQCTQLLSQLESRRRIMTLLACLQRQRPSGSAGSVVLATVLSVCPVRRGLRARALAQSEPASHRAMADSGRRPAAA